MPARLSPYDVELQLERELAAVTDAQERAILAAWAMAWSEVSGDLFDTLLDLMADGARITAATVVRSERLARTLAAIADKIEDLATQAGVTISSDLAGVLDQAINGTAGLIRAQLEDVRRVDLDRRPTSRALDAIVQRVTEQITSTLLPIADETYAVIQRELIRGVAVGDSPRETARRMVERSENLWNFGRSRAVNVARTETLDAYRSGAKAAEEPHADILAGWTWLAHLGPRTCRSCLAMHGELFPLDKPGPDDHQQGRCSRCPVVKGEDDGEPDLSWVPSADEHFESLDRADQIAILGRRGYQAWASGDFPREQWTKTRTSDGWRDAQVPASPGDADAGSGRGGGDTPGDLRAEDPDDIAVRLDVAYADWADTLDEDQSAAVHAWQGMDRHYQLMQKLVRQGIGDDDLADEVEALQSAIEAGRLPFAVEGWRGVRSSLQTFGMDSAALPDIEGRVLSMVGFFGLSVDRAQAVGGFTVPALRGGPVLMRVSLPAGVAAAWVAIAGDPELRNQLELLLAGPISLRIGRVTYDGEIPVLEVEVIL